MHRLLPRVIPTLGHRLEPPPLGREAGGREHPVDGLRGFCALLVLYGHLFFNNRMLDPAYIPAAAWGWFDLGAPAVLIFFVLSGYVIGLTVSGPASPAAVARYAGRRAVRLIPIVYASIGLAWLLAPATQSWTVLGNLLFLQNYFSYPGGLNFPVIWNDPTLWSLHYEVVYYAAFIIVWWLRPPAALPILGALALGTAPVFGIHPSHLLIRYSCGALYWTSGLCLAWLTPPDDGLRAGFSNWPSAALAAYAVWALGPVREALIGTGLLDIAWTASLLPHRLDFLIPSLWLMSAASGRAPRLRQWLLLVSLALSCIGILYAARMTGWTPQKVLGALAAALSLLLCRWQAPRSWLARLAPIGSISFGIYVLGVPLQMALRGTLAGFRGTPVTFGVRVAAAVALTFALSWLLERRFQPWVAARFKPLLYARRPQAAPDAGPAGPPP